MGVYKEFLDAQSSPILCHSYHTNPQKAYDIPMIGNRGNYTLWAGMMNT